MTKIFRRLLLAYKRHGYSVRSGLNPYYLNNPDEGFTAIYHNQSILSTGRGLSLIEIMFLEELLSTTKETNNILVIGNAFGWSTLAVAMASPSAQVVAVDALIEGTEASKGKSLTLQIAEEEKLNIKVIDALSPRDIENVVTNNFNGKLDFVLIDGLHVNEQLLKDFKEVSCFASPDCIYFCHDVLNWHLLKAIKEITSLPCVHSSEILTRLSSGPALIFSQKPDVDIVDIVGAYVDETFDPDEYISSNGGTAEKPGPYIEERLAREYRFGLIDYVKLYADTNSLEQMTSILSSVVKQYPENSEVSFRVGACLLDLAYINEAIPFFKLAIKQSSMSGEPYHQLGRISRMQKEYAKAIEYFEAAIHIMPEWYPPYLEKGFIEVERENVEVAISYFMQAVTLGKQYSENSEVSFSAGACLLDLAYINEAIPFFKLAIKQTPMSGEPYHQLGRISRMQKEYAKAMEYFEAAIHIMPEWYPPYLEKGFIEVERENVEVAISYFTQAVTLGKQYSEVPFSAGACLLDLAYINEAIPFFELAIKQAPMSGEPYHQLGRISRMQKEHTKAIEYFEAAIHVMPEWYPPYAEKGFIEIERGNVEAAISYFMQAATFSNEPFIQIELYHLHLSRGHLQDALICLEEWQVLAPDDVLPWEAFIAHFSSEDENGRVVSLLERVCQTHPNWGGAVKALGMGLRKAGRYKESIMIFENPNGLLPAWPGAGVLYEIALTYWEMKEFDAAISCLERALLSHPNFKQARELLKKINS